MAELTENEEYIVAGVSVLGFLVLVTIGFLFTVYVKVLNLKKELTSLAANKNDDPLTRFTITRAKIDDSTYGGIGGSVPNRFNPRSNDNFDGVVREVQQHQQQQPQSPTYPQQPQIFPQSSNFSNQPLNYNQSPQPFGDNFVSDRENYNSNGRHPQKFRTNQVPPSADYNNKYY